jgi:hypothetical protein
MDRIRRRKRLSDMRGFCLVRSNRMVSMAEQLQAAQIEEARRIHELTRLDSRRGQWLGWSTTVLAMGGAMGCLYFGYPWVAAPFLSVPVMAVAKALVESAKSQSPAEIIKAATQMPPAGTQASPAVPNRRLSADG